MLLGQQHMLVETEGFITVHGEGKRRELACMKESIEGSKHVNFEVLAAASSIRNT